MFSGFENLRVDLYGSLEIDQITFAIRRPLCWYEDDILYANVGMQHATIIKSFYSFHTENSQ